jgi:hypothetical protein
MHTDTIDRKPVSDALARSHVAEAADRLQDAAERLEALYGPHSPEAEAVWTLFDHAHDLLGPRSF